MNLAYPRDCRFRTLASRDDSPRLVSARHERGGDPSRMTLLPHESLRELPLHAQLCIPQASTPVTMAVAY
jgi:hypothetical protein